MSIDAVLTTEARGLLAAAIAYRSLATCYRIGREPSNKLWKTLEMADVLLDRYSKAR